MDEAARKLAQGWLCSEPIEARSYDCSVCRAFDSGRMVDFHVVRPWGPSSMIKLDAWRPPPVGRKPDEDAPKPTLIEFLRTPPLMAKHKVVLLEQCDRMNHDFSNALLKSLEEPPPYVRMILTTSEFSRLLPTVRSRCMAVACPSLVPSEPSEMERVLGGSPGLLAKIRASLDAYEQVWRVFESSLTAPWFASIVLADQTRDAAESLAKSQKSNTRAGQVEAARCLAAWLLARRPERPDLAKSAIEVHKFLVGNVNAGASLDWLWSEILAK